MATPEQYISDRPKSVSDKQTDVLRVIAKGNQDGTPVTRSQIIERVSYPATKTSVTFITRYMLAQGRILKIKMATLPSGVYKGHKDTVGYVITDEGRRLIFAE